MTRGTLFTYDMDQYLSFSLLVVEIDENDLLPRSQGQFPLDQGNGERRLHQGCTDMGEAIAVTPAFVVLIRDIGRLINSGRETSWIRTIHQFKCCLALMTPRVFSTLLPLLDRVVSKEPSDYLQNSPQGPSPFSIHRYRALSSPL